MVPEKIILPEIPASINADIMSEEDLQAKLQAGYDNIEEGKIRLFKVWRLMRWYNYGTIMS